MSSFKPFIRRTRPIDATGLFWCTVLLLVAGLIYLIEPSNAYTIFLAPLPLVVIWQIWRWRSDHQFFRLANEWCLRYYPEELDTSMVEFIAAVAMHSVKKLTDVSPQTPLAELNPIVQFPDEFIFESEFEGHVLWLNDLFAEARLKNIDSNNLDGDNLHDAIKLLIDREIAA